MTTRHVVRHRRASSRERVPPCPIAPQCRAGRRARDRAGVRTRGFTLIEVLIALAIVAIALASAMRAVGSAASNTEALHQRLLAGWSADNRLAELHLQRSWPDFGTTTFPCAQGDLPMTCVQTVTATPNPLFRRVEVSVRSAATGSTLLADLVTVVADETRRPL